MARKSPSSQSSPADQHPRKKLLSHGADSLTDIELLTLILSKGTPQEDERRLSMLACILGHFGGLQGLMQASLSAVQSVESLGADTTAQVLALIEVGRRLRSYPAERPPQVQNAEDAARLVVDMAHLPQEHTRVILLDLAQRVIAMPTVYIGTLSMSVVRVSEIYREAIIRNAPALVLVHNHPSGDSTPSPEDIELTRTLIAAGKLLDIVLVDHLIISPYGWSSLKMLGLAFS